MATRKLRLCGAMLDAAVDEINRLRREVAGQRDLAEAWVQIATLDHAQVVAAWMLSPEGNRQLADLAARGETPAPRRRRRHVMTATEGNEGHD